MISPYQHGDLVICIDNPSLRRGQFTNNWEKNKIYEVSSIKESYDYPGDFYMHVINVDTKLNTTEVLVDLYASTVKKFEKDWDS